jgi:hypothetical protein
VTDLKKNKDAKEYRKKKKTTPRLEENGFWKRKKRLSPRKLFVV